MDSLWERSLPYSILHYCNRTPKTGQFMKNYTFIYSFAYHSHEGWEVQHQDPATGEGFPDTSWHRGRYHTARGQVCKLRFVFLYDVTDLTLMASSTPLQTATSYECGSLVPSTWIFFFWGGAHALSVSPSDRAGNQVMKYLTYIAQLWRCHTGIHIHIHIYYLLGLFQAPPHPSLFQDTHLHQIAFAITVVL